MRVVNITALNALGAAATRNSAAVDALLLDRASVTAQVASATSPVATLKLQGSNDVPGPGASGMPAAFTPTNWYDVPGASAAVAANGNLQIPMTELSHRWLRVQYLFTSGTGGTVTAQIHATGKA